MALLHPRNLAISIVGRAGWGSWEETGGSICTQMSLDLILETAEGRPCVDRKLKNLHRDGVELIARRCPQGWQGILLCVEY
jgi:hypothetical protein